MHTTLTCPHYYGACGGHALRPDVGCTFGAMRTCDATFGNGSLEAQRCREGARDAHLLDYTFVRDRAGAYATGRSLALTCPPSVDESYYRYVPYRVAWR